MPVHTIFIPCYSPLPEEYLIGSELPEHFFCAFKNRFVSGKNAELPVNLTFESRAAHDLDRAQLCHAG